MSALLDLRDEAARDPLEIPGLADIPAEARAVALENWRGRMVSEHASARVFAAFLNKLIRAGAPRRHIVAASAMIEEELEHGRLCARVVTALGGEALAALPEALPEVPAHEDATPTEAVLRDAISIGCCSETVAVALVGAERAQAGAPSLREVLERILADEVGHARLGWKLVDELAPTLDAAARRRLGAYLVATFEHQLAFHAPFLRWPSATDRAVSIGAPDGPENWRVFVETIEGVTLPGLERRGLPARRAWAIARERTVSAAAA